jgi:PleD family two-component response regulator
VGPVDGRWRSVRRLRKETAAAWRSTIRVTDLLARYGGEELALVARADTALYAAKEGGRDRCVIA